MPHDGDDHCFQHLQGEASFSALIRQRFTIEETYLGQGSRSRLGRLGPRKLPPASLVRGSIYTTIRKSGPKHRTIEGSMGPNSLMVVYVDPLGQSVSLIQKRTTSTALKPLAIAERLQLVEQLWV